jgi:hypothetical protein
VQLAALTALAALGPTAAAAVPALVELSLVLLRATGDRIRAMVRLCRSPSGQRRSFDEVRTAGQGEALAALFRLDRWLQTLTDAVDACICGMGAAAVPALVAALGDSRWPARAFAVRALRLVGPAARVALPAAQRAAEDPEYMVRWEARISLRYLEAGLSAGPREMYPLDWLADPDQPLPAMARGEPGERTQGL